MNTIETIADKGTAPSVRKSLLAVLAKNLSKEIKDNETSKSLVATKRWNLRSNKRAAETQDQEDQEDDDTEFGSTFLMYCTTLSIKE